MGVQCPHRGDYLTSPVCRTKCGSVFAGDSETAREFERHLGRVGVADEAEVRALLNSASKSRMWAADPVAVAKLLDGARLLAELLDRERTEKKPGVLRRMDAEEQLRNWERRDQAAEIIEKGDLEVVTPKELAELRQHDVDQHVARGEETIFGDDEALLQALEEL